jgi:hypothetical protein
MLAQGFTNALFDSLTRDGLVTMQPGTVRTGTRRITVVWVVITDAGRAVAAAQSQRWAHSGSRSSPCIRIQVLNRPPATTTYFCLWAGA